MTPDFEHKPIKQRFDYLLKHINGERFLKKQGLGNDVPFFICPFESEEAIEISKMQKQLIKQLKQSGVQVLEINLYDLAIEIIKNRGIWDEIIQKEKDMSKAELTELLQNILDSHSYLVPAIAERMQKTDFDVMFITGVGEVFPYIRSHNVLNNLQSTAKEQPTVMFFPGTYIQLHEKGTSLNLFERFHDNYYRAFNIYQRGT